MNFRTLVRKIQLGTTLEAGAESVEPDRTATSSGRQFCGAERSETAHWKPAGQSAILQLYLTAVALATPFAFLLRSATQKARKLGNF